MGGMPGGRHGKPGGRPGDACSTAFSRLEVLELTDSVTGPGIAGRVRALARLSKTTPQPWVYEAGARLGLS